MPFHPALRWVYYPVLGFFTYDFVHTSLFRLQWVTGNSMSPTLAPDWDTSGKTELVLVFKRTFAGSAISTLQRGDIVTLTKPHDPLNGESVKRVVGLPGDTVFRDVRRVGKQEVEESRNSKVLGLRGLPPVVRVPSGAVWIEGDGWRRSRDSNDLGPVSQSLINGRVWGVVWPPSRFGALERRTAPDSRTKILEGSPPVATLDMI